MCVLLWPPRAASLSAMYEKIVPQCAGELGDRLTTFMEPQFRLLTRAAAAASNGCSPGALFLGDAVVPGPAAVGCIFRGAAAEVDELVHKLQRSESKGSWR